MSPYNKWFLCCGVGIFHSGIEVYGAEYAYGGKLEHERQPYILVEFPDGYKRGGRHDFLKLIFYQIFFA